MTPEDQSFPPPFVPSEVDLRGFQWMKLDLNRLFNSDFFSLSSGEEFRAGLTLWGKSFQQTPAGSLPDDDRTLAVLAGYGRDVKTWGKVKTMAMRGWILCNDGRLYHKVVAEIVLEAWKERQRYRTSKDADVARKQKERDERQQMFHQLKKLGHHLPWDTPTSTLRSLLANRAPVTVTGAGQPTDSHAPVTPFVTAKTGTETGTETTTTTLPSSSDRNDGCGGGLDVDHLPDQIKAQALKAVASLDQQTGQQILDVAAAGLQDGTIRAPLKLIQHLAEQPATLDPTPGIHWRQKIEAKANAAAARSRANPQAATEIDIGETQAGAALLAAFRKRKKAHGSTEEDSAHG